MSTFDPYHKWLAIPPAEQPPHHYRLLGVALYEADLDVIEAAADRQMSYIRQCATGPYTKESQKILNELSAARVCLLNKAKKEAYDRELKARLAPPKPAEPATAIARPRVTRIPAKRQPVDDVPEEDEYAMVVLERSSGGSNLTLPPRRRSKKRSRQNPYWLWGGGGLALLIVGALIYPGSKPGSDAAGGKPDEPAGNSATDPRAVAGNRSNSRDAGPGKTNSGNTARAPVIDYLLKRIAPDRNAFRGTWHFDGETLVSPATPFARLQVPVTPPESYVLRATVEAAAIKDCLALGLVVGDRQVTIVLNGFNNTISGMQLIDRQMIPTNGTKTGLVLKAGSPNQIVCTVTAGHIEATCNGKQFLNWTGDFNRLLAGPDWEPPNKRQLYLGTNLTSYRISKLELEPLSPGSGGTRTAPATAGTRTPPPGESTSPAPKEKGPPREIVERILELDGTLSVKVAAAPGAVPVKALADLPADDFEIFSVGLKRGTPADLEFICSVPIGGSGIALSGTNFGDDHLAACVKAKSLGEIRLEGTSCTDAGLVHLARVTALQRLALIQSKFTAAGWKNLQQIADLTVLQVITSDVSSEHLACLAGLSKLRFLHFQVCQVDGRGFRAFRGKHQPDVLVYFNCALDAAGMQAIGEGLSDLKVLDVSYSSSDAPITDEVVEGLRNMKGLQVLRLDRTNITDKGLSIIADLANLNNLMLSGAAVTGTGFRDHAGKLPNLRNCVLNETRLSDEGLQQLLEAAPRLENLMIVKTAVTEKGLKQLKDVQQVKNLTLSKDRFSPAALDELREALPQCKINLQ